MKIFNKVSSSIKDRSNKRKIRKQVKKDIADLGKRLRHDLKDGNIMEGIFDKIEAKLPHLFTEPSTPTKLHAIGVEAISVLIDKNQKSLVADAAKRGEFQPKP